MIRKHINLLWYFSFFYIPIFSLYTYWVFCYRSLMKVQLIAQMTVAFILKKSLLLNGTDYSSSAHNFVHFFCAAVIAKLLLFILNFFYTANIIPLCNVCELKIVIL